MSRIKKMKSKLTPVLLAVLLIVQMFLPVQVFLDPPYIEIQEAEAYGNGWLDGWDYRTPIKIDGNTEDLTNYQVQVTLQGTNSSADNYVDFDKVLTGGADIRFTDDDKETPIDFWIEEWVDTAESESATVWVEVPSLLTAGIKTIYVYYGKLDVSSGSDGDNTFEFFDGFEQYNTSVEKSWDILDIFDLSVMRHSLLYHIYDVDNDGDYDLLTDINVDNITLAAIDQNDTILWQTEIIDTYAKPAYMPRTADIDNDGVIEIIYGNDNKIVCVNSNDGTIQWARDLSFNVLDLGNITNDSYLEVVGGKDALYVLNGNDGSTIWTNPILPYEQITITGDIDGDGFDEVLVALQDANGTIRVIDNDGTNMFDITYPGNIFHHDEIYVTDFDTSNEGKEIVTQVNGSSLVVEGQGIGVYDNQGNLLRERTIGSTTSGGTTFRIGEIRNDLDGYEIAYLIEGANTVGLLDNDLSLLWETSVITDGQIQLGDVNGDGEKDIIYTTGESYTANLAALDKNGNNIITWESPFGWDNTFSAQGDPGYGGEVFYYRDFDNDGVDEVVSTGSSYAGSAKVSTPHFISILTAIPSLNPYIIGSLSGQGDWVSTVGTSWNVDNNTIKHGLRAVGSGTSLDNWEVQKHHTALSNNVLIIGYWVRSGDPSNDKLLLLYNGESPDSTASIISIYSDYIKAYDGNGVGGGSWVDLISASADTWYYVEEIINNINGYYDVKVDGILYNNGGAHFGFRHNPSSQSWFRILRGANGNYSAFVDSIYIRKYTSTEPTAATTSSFRGYDKIFTGITNTISATDYVSYSAEPTVSNLVDITITPASSSINTTITTWNTSSPYYKKWTETGSGNIDTAHTVGDLETSKYYTVWYTKDGGTKTRLTTQQAASSQISFTYDQGYSDVEFDIEEDTTAPAVFDLSSPSDNSYTNDNTPTLSWNASSDSESGLAKYQLYIDDVLDKDNIDSSATSTEPTSSLSDGSYTWYVKAVDNAGNERQSTSTRTINIDTVSSFATFDSGAPLDPINQNTTDITVAGTDVTHYKYKLDDGSYSSATAIATHLALSDLTDGEHTIYLIGRDTAGNWQAEGSATEHTWTVDITSPVISLSSPANNSSTGDTKPTLIWSGSDATSGIAKYQLYVDSSLDTDNISNSATSTTPANNLTCGSHTWYVRAIDNVDNYTNSTAFNLTISCGSGLPPSAYNPPTQPESDSENPESGFSIVINSGDKYTNNSTVTLKLNAGSDTAKMAISNYSDFQNASQIDYQEEIGWDLLGNPPSPLLQRGNTYAVYAKFYTRYGVASEIVSDSIILKTETNSQKDNQGTGDDNPEDSNQQGMPNMETSSNPNNPQQPDQTEPAKQSSTTFTQTLKFDSNNNQVIQLQNKLRELNFFPKDIKSNGNFGPATEQAVMDYQKSKGIHPCGIVGPRTRKALNNQEFITNKDYQFTKDLKYNDKNEEIKQLQTRLRDQNFFPYYIQSTGWFGPITEKAVKLFQKFYELIENGIVDEEMRGELNG